MGSANKAKMMAKPTRWKCPFCDMWHDWNEGFLFDPDTGQPTNVKKLYCPYTSESQRQYMYIECFGSEKYNIQSCICHTFPDCPSKLPSCGLFFLPDLISFNRNNEIDNKSFVYTDLPSSIYPDVSLGGTIKKNDALKKGRWKYVININLKNKNKNIAYKDCEKCGFRRFCSRYFDIFEHKEQSEVSFALEFDYPLLETSAIDKKELETKTLSNEWVSNKKELETKMSEGVGAMNGSIMKMMAKPKRWKCPFCGEWHIWKGGSLFNPETGEEYGGSIRQRCSYMDGDNDQAEVEFWSAGTGSIYAYIDDRIYDCAGNISKNLIFNIEKVSYSEKGNIKSRSYSDESTQSSSVIGNICDTDLYTSWKYELKIEVHNDYINNEDCENCYYQEACVRRHDIYDDKNISNVVLGLEFDYIPPEKKEVKDAEYKPIKAVNKNKKTQRTTEGGKTIMKISPISRTMGRPTKWKCPYCDEWHDWDEVSLLDPDTDEPNGIITVSCKCSVAPKEMQVDFFATEEGDICARIIDSIEGCHSHISNEKLYFHSDKVKYTGNGIASERFDAINTSDSLRNIVEQIYGCSGTPEEKEWTYEINFDIPNDGLNFKNCEKCRHHDSCLRYHKSYERKSAASIALEFEWVPPAVKSGKTATNNINKTKKERKNMAKNNLFNLGNDYGKNTDENIASTILGIAVKNGDNWRIFDKKKKEIIDAGNVELDSLPIYIIPAIKVVAGDLIKDENGEYGFITEVKSGTIEMMLVKNGEIKTVVPVKNIFGFSCYTRVIAIGDILDIDGGEISTEKLFMMSAMSGTNNSMLPLMLMMDKEKGMDIDKMLMLMVVTASSNGEDNEGGAPLNDMLLPMMLLKGKDGDSNDIMKMMMLSSMSGGSGSMNNIMPLLMMDKLFAKENTISDDNNK